MQKFQLAKGWKFLTYIFSPLMIGLFGWTFWVLLMGDNTWLFVLMIPVCVGMILLFIYAMHDAAKGAIILTDEAIIHYDIFGAKKLSLDKIKGIRLDEHYLIFESDDKKKIKVSRYLTHVNSLITWGYEHFPDLDDVAKVTSEMEILSNEEFGITPEQREAQLATARRVCKYLNNGAWLLAAWIIFYPKPYEVAALVLCIYPIILIGVGYVFPKLIQYDDDEKTAYPSVTLALAITSLSLMLRILFDYNLLEYDTLWIYISLMAIVLMFGYLLPMGVKVNSFYRVFLLTLVALFMLSYSFGLYVFTNCLLDKSSGKVFTTTLADKRISTGKTTTYYLELNPWEDRKVIEDVKVSKEFYESFEVGDSIQVTQYAGALNTPWLIVEPE